jgi:hypothetical protein
MLSGEQQQPILMSFAGFFLKEEEINNSLCL